MDTQGILIIILSITLIVFLLVALILLLLLIKVAKNVKVVTEKAEMVATNLAGASQYLKPAAISSMAVNFVKSIKKQAKKKL